MIRLLWLCLAAPLMLAACDVPAGSTDAVDDPAGGYTLEVRAEEDEQLFVVTAPDGRRTASRVAAGASTLLDANAIQSLAAAAPVADAGAQAEVFALRFPGVDISVSADGADPNSESATVRVNAAGRSVRVDAEDGGPGENDDRANVRITGASETDARKFIEEAQDVSPEVRAQMLAAIGLGSTP